MKQKNLFILSLLTVLFFIHYGCTVEPVTVATSSDGVEISFSNQGSGEPAIVLVHGWTNNNTIWDLQVPVLSEKYQVLAVDLAGHGKSGNNRTDWTIESFGQDIAAVVDVAELNNVILVGFSMGGPAILEAAGLIPEQVSGLILVDAINDPEAQYPPPMVDWIDSVYMDMILNPNLETLVGLGFFVNNPEESFQKVLSMIDRDKSGWSESLKDAFRWSNEKCSASLEALRVPLIAINTDHMPTEVDNFKKYAPSFEAKILSGSGHVMMWDITEEFNRTLSEAIEDILAAEQAE